jgi:hypothetical protein
MWHFHDEHLMLLERVLKYARHECYLFFYHDIVCVFSFPVHALVTIISWSRTHTLLSFALCKETYFFSVCDDDDDTVAKQTFSWKSSFAGDC